MVGRCHAIQQIRMNNFTCECPCGPHVTSAITPISDAASSATLRQSRPGASIAASHDDLARGESRKAAVQKQPGHGQAGAPLTTQFRIGPASVVTGISGSKPSFQHSLHGHLRRAPHLRRLRIRRVPLHLSVSLMKVSTGCCHCDDCVISLCQKVLPLRTELYPARRQQREREIGEP